MEIHPAPPSALGSRAGPAAGHRPRKIIVDENRLLSNKRINPVTRRWGNPLAHADPSPATAGDGGPTSSPRRRLQANRVPEGGDPGQVPDNASLGRWRLDALSQRQVGASLEKRTAGGCVQQVESGRPNRTICGTCSDCYSSEFSTEHAGSRNFLEIHQVASIEIDYRVKDLASVARDGQSETPVLTCIKQGRCLIRARVEESHARFLRLPMSGYEVHTV